jgi:hypothetical protein
MSMEQAGLGFERDIRPHFRADDVNTMSFAFNLAYEDVQMSAEAIYQRLDDGSMPCDIRWPPEQVERFETAIDAGSPL